MKTQAESGDGVARTWRRLRLFGKSKCLVCNSLGVVRN
jgi:hypothetical protein